MIASLELHEGKQRLIELLERIPPSNEHWNEATNRFQFIDELLIHCLGWQKPDFRVEEIQEDGGRSDYIFGNPAKAVLEAKRPALLWEDLPAPSRKKHKSTRSLCEASSEFKKAIAQVIPYCAIQGAGLGIICNGPQMAIFQAISIGASPMDGECIFFNGFDDYLKDFALLWKVLSPEGVTENRALNELSKSRTLRLPPKASNSITEPYQYRYRTSLQEELKSLGSILLEEIEDDPELRRDFYRECYVPLEANNRHLNLSKQIIERRYERVAQDGSAPAPLRSSGAAGGLTESVFMNAGSKPLVVIGDVGVGKTSFFENLALSVDGGKAGNTYLIPIDLGINANLSRSIKDYVLEAIPEVLLRRYKIDINEMETLEAIYDIDLKQFDKSAKGAFKKTDTQRYTAERIDFLVRKSENLGSHIQNALRHISKGHKKRVVLIIDNADQRTFADQQEAFLIAQELAATRAMFVFVALRPSTFYLSKTTGALSAYQNKILTISPPPADIVIEKRIGFALRVAEGKVSPGGLEGIRLNLPSIVSFLKATLRSVRSSNDIKQFLSNITGGNVRAVIELITTFCGSPNVDSRKIVEIEADSGNYHIPIHEFTKHALLGEFTYFNPQSSTVACNVFDVFNPSPREHFLRLLIVAYLSASETVRDKDGFVRGADLIAAMSQNAFSEHQTVGAIRALAEKKLVETPYSHYREVQDDESPIRHLFRATSVGVYHLRHWSYGFSFLDAVSTDTPIFDEQTRMKVSDLAGALDIRSRLVKAGAFREYLLASWHASNFDSPYLDFPSMMASEDRQFEAVHRAVAKMTGFQRAR